jgi:hypothetical protein
MKGMNGKCPADMKCPNISRPAQGNVKAETMSHKPRYIQGVTKMQNKVDSLGRPLHIRGGK